MAQAHGDRLSAVDASFLAQESAERAHAHRRGDGLRGPAAGLRRLRRARPLPPAPRAALPPEARVPADRDRAGRCGSTTRASTSSTTCATPRCPRPGTEEQLRALAARIVSQQLDRTKPLWELWLVEGLEDGRFALISKTHHALVDGVAGVDLATVLFDLDAGAAGAPARGRAVGAAAASRARVEWPRAASRGLRAAAVRPARRARCGAARGRPRRCTPRARPSRASARSRGRA